MEVAAANGIPGSGAAALSKGVPGWSLESWIGSLSFDKVVADALTSRLEKAMEEAGITGGLGDTASQEAFLRSLAINGGVDVTLALLKETPVLKRMAEAICDNATELQRLKDEQEQAALFEQTEEVEGGELSPQTYADRGNEAHAALFTKSKGFGAKRALKGIVRSRTKAHFHASMWV